MRHVKKFTWHVALNLVLWAIETAIFNRIRHFVLGEQRDEAWLKNARDMAVSVADELESRKLDDAMHALRNRNVASLVARELRGRDVDVSVQDVAAALGVTAEAVLESMHRDVNPPRPIGGRL